MSRLAFVRKRFGLGRPSLVVMACILVPVLSCSHEKGCGMAGKPPCERASKTYDQTEPTSSKLLGRRVPDFKSMGDVEERKKAFFAFMVPLVQKVNEKISRKRDHLLKLYHEYKKTGHVSHHDMVWLRDTAAAYGIPGISFSTPQAWKNLSARVDIVPPSLALAQAANESNWGTSRFARKGNNYFGQWCHTRGCGLVPERRPEGAHYEVARFSSPLDSVKAYAQNINTNRAYAELRVIRAKERGKGKEPKGYTLSEGLESYSARGLVYVHSLQALIKNNNLEQYDN